MPVGWLQPLGGEFAVEAHARRPVRAFVELEATVLSSAALAATVQFPGPLTLGSRRAAEGVSSRKGSATASRAFERSSRAGIDPYDGPAPARRISPAPQREIDEASGSTKASRKAELEGHRAICSGAGLCRAVLLLQEQGIGDACSGALYMRTSQLPHRHHGLPRPVVRRGAQRIRRRSGKWLLSPGFALSPSRHNAGFFASSKRDIRQLNPDRRHHGRPLHPPG